MRNQRREWDALQQDNASERTGAMQRLRWGRVLGGALDSPELVERQMMVVTATIPVLRSAVATG